MSSFFREIDRRRSVPTGTTAVVVALLILGGVACQTESETDREGGREDAPPVVEVKATDYAFAMPDSIRSGWTTFRMTNTGKEHHLFTFLRLPEGISYEEFQREVIAPYDSVWSQVVRGDISPAKAQKRLKPLLPPWYPGEIVQPGGVSLTAPGRTAQTTLHLEPGTYVLECYLRTPKNQYHALRGMVRSLTVTRDSSGALPPKADHKLTVTNLKLEGVGPVSPGEHTFAVRFGEYPGGYPHQHVHLARLNDTTGAGDLAEWITVDPVMPVPATFLGGAQHIPAGNTAYVTAELKAGRYAWVVGVPPEKGEVESFTVK